MSSKVYKKMADQNIQFGKYITYTFAEILKEDPSYAKWLTTQPIIDIDVKDYLLDNLYEGYIMPFGKYKNKPLEYIKRTDYQYINYLKRNQYVQDKMPQLHKMLYEPII